MSFDKDLNAMKVMTETQVSEEEAKLLHALRTLGLEPKLQDPGDLARLSRIFSGRAAADEAEEARRRLAEAQEYIDRQEEDRKARREEAEARSRHHYPKFSTFFGDGRGDVSWDTFKSEVYAVLDAKHRMFDDEQILFGVRRSLKGAAGDKLRRLGPDVEVRDVMKNLEKAYGTVETKESIMKRFYTCEQNSNESVEQFASRLEEIFDKAVELKAVRRSDTVTMKHVLHSGLKKELKHASTYQCDKMESYEDFKRELRRIEADLGSSSQEKKPCKPAVAADRKEKTESPELADLVKKLNDRIDKLEKGPEQQQYMPQFERHYWRGPPRGGYMHRGGARGRGSGHGRGFVRPTGTNTFAPLCFLCKQKGHIQKNCPKILAQFVCTNCKEKGHTRKDCPNL